MIILKKKRFVASTHAVRTAVALMVVKLEIAVIAVVAMAAVMIRKVAAKVKFRTSISKISPHFRNL